MSTSTSSASGRISTVADDVWIRPWLSVTGTRCTRCGPPSNFSRLHAVSPRTTIVTWLKPPRSLASSASTSTDQPLFAAYARYISYRSRANRLASSPPSAPRISTITELPSFGSLGSSRRRSSASAPARRSSIDASSARHTLAFVAARLGEQLAGLGRVVEQLLTLADHLDDRGEILVPAGRRRAGAAGR